jgi:hypothetical protein
MSLFAFITAAIAAKLKPIPDVEATRRIEELERENKELQARLNSALQDVAGWASIANSWRQRYEEGGQRSMANVGYDVFCNCVPSRAQVWASDTSRG